MSKKRKYLLFSFISAFIISGIALATILSNILYTPAMGEQTITLSTNDFEIHFISLNKSQLENSAKSLAEDYQKIGAGGYIWQIDEYYHILSSGFENKNDAILVQNNLSSTSGIESEIISIKFKGIKIEGNFNNDEKRVLTKAMSIFQEIYKSLYDIAISVDTMVYNEISARLAINSVHSNINTTKADFDTLFKANQTASIKNLSTHLNNTLKTSESLCSGVPLNQSQTYASLIKYRYIEILKIYEQLTKAL